MKHATLTYLLKGILGFLCLSVYNLMTSSIPFQLSLVYLVLALVGGCIWGLVNQVRAGILYGHVAENTSRERRRPNLTQQVSEGRVGEASL